MTNIYERIANLFLNKHGLVIHAQLAPFTPPQWLGKNGVCGEKYRVTVMRKQSEESIELDYWSSFHDAQKGDRPTEYDILSCLSSDANLSSVKELLSEGASPDQALAAVKHGDKLRNFFTGEELKDLQRIR